MPGYDIPMYGEHNRTLLASDLHCSFSSCWLYLNPGIFWGYRIAICALPNRKYMANAISMIPTDLG
jgi:hypothetical protein